MKLNIYKKDPDLVVGDIIGRYIGKMLVSARVIKLEKDKIHVARRTGDFIVAICEDEDTFLWEGYFFRIQRGLWDFFSPRADMPLLRLANTKSKRTITLVNTNNGTFRYSMPFVRDPTKTLKL